MITNRTQSYLEGSKLKQDSDHALQRVMSTNVLRAHMSAVASRVDKKSSEKGGGGGAKKVATKSTTTAVPKKPKKSLIQMAKKSLEIKERKKYAITHFYKTGQPIKASRKQISRRIRALKKN